MWSCVDPASRLRLLHEEYIAAHPNGYGYTQFVAHYNAWADKQRVVMRQVHKAGEKCFVDYAGQKPLRRRPEDRRAGRSRTRRPLVPQFRSTS